MVEAPRFQLTDMPQDAYRHLLQMEGLIAQQVEPTLYHLIKLRGLADQRLRFLPRDAYRRGVEARREPERIVSLDAWEELPLYSDKERAALAWTEELTLIADSGASSESFEASKPQFQRRGDQMADLRRGPDQQLEPDRDQSRLAVRPQDVPAGRAGQKATGAGLSAIAARPERRLPRPWPSSPRLRLPSPRARPWRSGTADIRSAAGR